MLRGWNVTWLKGGYHASLSYTQMDGNICSGGGGDDHHHITDLAAAYSYWSKELRFMLLGEHIETDYQDFIALGSM